MIVEWQTLQQMIIISRVKTSTEKSVVVFVKKNRKNQFDNSISEPKLDSDSKILIKFEI